MQLECPECGSTHVRHSHPRHIGEKLADLFGFTQLRCSDCDERWTASIWRFTEFFYARCPRCFRLDLARWEETYYRVPGTWRFAIALGAKKVRCRACRHNFVSFRLVRGKRKWENIGLDEVVLEETTISLEPPPPKAPPATGPLQTPPAG
jgi:endogenous inhibitor of DNA gyrase (YacG/DUF329 family)